MRYSTMIEQQHQKLSWPQAALRVGERERQMRAKVQQLTFTEAHGLQVCYYNTSSKFVSEHLNKSMSHTVFSTVSKSYCLQKLKYHVKKSTALRIPLISSIKARCPLPLERVRAFAVQHYSLFSSLRFCTRGCTSTEIINTSQACDEGDRYP